MHVASVPQGQGHRTVLAQVVADVLGLKPADIRVITEIDTAQGRLVDRVRQLFEPLRAGGRRHRATRGRAPRDELARIAAAQLNVAGGRDRFAGGRVRARAIPTTRCRSARVAAPSHWSPGTLPETSATTMRETVFWTPPELTAPTRTTRSTPRSATASSSISAASRSTASPAPRIDRYVTMHDCGRSCIPAWSTGR